MGVTRGPQYPGIEDGLIFCFDPKNRDCWSGGGMTGTVYDSVNNLSGTVSFANADDEFAGALTTEGYFEYDGTDDYIEIASTDFQFSGDFSISFWANPSSLATYERFLDYTYFAGGHGWAFAVTGAHKLDFVTCNSGTIKTTTSTTTLLTGTWYNITAVFDLTNNIQRIYVNGTQEHTVAVTVAPTYTNVTKLGICARLQGTEGSFPVEVANAGMGPLMIYNRVLSAAEVLKNYNQLKGRFS